MSRGRGGFGGGRGGRGGKLGGSDVPWAYDPDVKPDYKPSELFPEVRQPAPGLITARERSQVARYRTLRDRIHEGPLYTVLGDSNSRVTKAGAAPAKVMIDPFEGMPTYTQKYRKKTRKVPRLDTRPYVLRFFPRELWSTLDPDRAMQEANDQPRARPKKKTLQIGMSSQQTSTLHRLSGNDDPMQIDEHASSRPPGAIIKTELDHNEEDEDDAGAGRAGALPEDELLDGVEEEEMDDDYESGEDEMAGDYMAEGYFDDGADDLGGEDYDGGGDGGDEGPLM